MYMYISMYVCRHYILYSCTEKTHRSTVVGVNAHFGTQPAVSLSSAAPFWLSRTPELFKTPFFVTQFRLPVPWLNLVCEW